MITSLRHTAWMLCGLLLAGAGSGCNSGDGEKPSQPGIGPAATLQLDAPMDMTSSAEMGTDMGSSCKAAEGLAADKQLLCVDFTTKLPDAQAGWTFPANCGGDMWKWTLTDGTLSLSNFGSFGDSAMNPMERACWFTSPAIDAGSFPSLTLSVLQKVDLRIDKDVQQRAQILIESTTSTLLAESTGRTSTSTFRRSTLTIPASEIQGKSLKFNLATRSLSGGGYTGWQIESIAVLGHK